MDHKTKLLYAENFDVTDCLATVISIKTSHDNCEDIVLDQTCFYPKGGGQDFDTGTIVYHLGKYKIKKFKKVEEVQIDHLGVVHHFTDVVGELKVGDKVTCTVSRERRNLNTRLHSAGHVLDMAVEARLPDWVPGKGAHYPDMSFVEYSAVVDMNTKNELIENIQTKLDEILSLQTVNTICFLDRSGLSAVCRHVPDNIPLNKPTRVVMYGSFGVPCGGTHVRSIDQIGTVRVTRIKRKNGKIRVSYSIS